MKPLLISIVAVSLTAACAQGGSQPPASAPPAAAPPAATAQPAAPAPVASAPAATPAPAAGTPAASSASAAPPTAAAPPAPTFREVTIPAGTALSVTLSNALASNKNKVEDAVRGAIAKPVIIAGVTALPKGTEIRGSVLDVKESGRVKGKASIAFRFDRIVSGDETYRIQSARISREADDKKMDDVKKGGIGAGVGAAVGAIAGGGKGAAIGAIAGGAGTVLATKGREVELAAGTPVTVSLQEALTVRVPIK